MGALWSILLPYKVTFPYTEENQEIFDEKYKDDFVLDSVNEHETKTKIDGEEFIYKYREKVYVIDNGLVTGQFKPLTNEIVNEWIKEYKDKENRDFYSVFFDIERTEIFLKAFNDLEFNGFTTEYIEKLRDSEKNCFMYDNHLNARWVIKGYSLPPSFNLWAISFFYSYEKMNVIMEETVAFYNFTEHIKKIFKDKYTISKHIFIIGF